MTKYNYLILCVFFLFLVFLFLATRYTDESASSLAGPGMNTELGVQSIEDGIQTARIDWPLDAGVPNQAEPQNDLCQDCTIWLSALESALTIDDESYEAMLAHTDRLADYVTNNTEARQALFEWALSTSDGNKRSIILAVFSQLNGQHRTELGLALSRSQYRAQRRDGIDFLADPATMDQSLAMEFSAMLATESDRHIKTSLIRALNQPQKFRDNQAVIESLSYIVATEMDSFARGEALLASASLVTDAETVVSDALAAIRSDDGDYQLYGLRTLDAILDRQSLEGTGLSWLSEESARDIFSELFASEYQSTSDLVLNEAGAIYARHF